MRGDLRDIVVRTLDKREFTLQVRDKTTIPDLKDAVASTTLIASESQVIFLAFNMLVISSLVVAATTRLFRNSISENPKDLFPVKTAQVFHMLNLTCFISGCYMAVSKCRMVICFPTIFKKITVRRSFYTAHCNKVRGGQHPARPENHHPQGSL